jgi:CDP-diacylglycerol--serine O-phosphatidyltransferase
VSRVLGITRPRLADLLTVGNALCGVGAVLAVGLIGPTGTAAAPNALRLAALLLVLGTILDTADGPAARRWGGSGLGLPLDTLADGVTFGVAPAVALTIVEGREASTAGSVVVVAGALLYVAGALLRLADFAGSRHEERGFTGLPSPLAAVCVIMLGFCSPAAWVTGLGLAVLAALMVSRVPYPPQGGPALVISLWGWAFGIAGILGVVDVRLPAALAAAVILVAPVWIALRHRTAPRAAADALAEAVTEAGTAPATEAA